MINFIYFDLFFIISIILVLIFLISIFFFSLMMINNARKKHYPKVYKCISFKLSISIGLVSLIFTIFTFIFYSLNKPIEIKSSNIDKLNINDVYSQLSEKDKNTNLPIYIKNNVTIIVDKSSKEVMGYNIDCYIPYNDEYYKCQTKIDNKRTIFSYYDDYGEANYDNISGSSVYFIEKINIDDVNLSNYLNVNNIYDITSKIKFDYLDSIYSGDEEKKYYNINFIYFDKSLAGKELSYMNVIDGDNQYFEMTHIVQEGSGIIVRCNSADIIIYLE